MIRKALTALAAVALALLLAHPAASAGVSRASDQWTGPAHH